jgi:hypothetical protein
MDGMARIAISFALAACVFGQPLPERYTCLRAASPVRIDGRLDDAAWRNAPWTGVFVDIEGASKPRPRFQTRVKMLWDDEYFYVGAELEEPHVWATLTEHDSVIFRDNDFELFLNPSGDGRNYFEFEINALNTSWDLFLPKPYREGGKADNSWEIPGLRTAVAIDGTINNSADRDRGWTVEIAIPWTAFASRAPVRRPAASEEWRVNFSRVEWQTELRRALREGCGEERGQLGVVAAGGGEHARAGQVGLRAVRERDGAARDKIGLSDPFDVPSHSSFCLRLYCACGAGRS